MIRTRAVPYYLSSVPVLLGGIRRPLSVLATLAWSGQRGGVGVEVMLNDGTRFLTRSLMDLWIIKETCLDRDYERIGPTIEDGWTVIDIGAGLGDFCVHVARRFPRARVIGFEPFAQSFELLQHNILLNKLVNIRAYPVAVSSHGGSMRLQLADEAVKHSTSTAPPDSTISGHTTKSVTLADAMNLEGVLECDLLKIDCEGGEFDILLNAPDELLQHFRHICLEYHDAFTAHRHRELVDRLSVAGFEVSVHPNRAYPSIGLLHARRTVPSST